MESDEDKVSNCSLYLCDNADRDLFLCEFLPSDIAYFRSLETPTKRESRASEVKQFNTTVEQVVQIPIWKSEGAIVKQNSNIKLEKKAKKKKQRAKKAVIQKDIVRRAEETLEELSATRAKLVASEAKNEELKNKIKENTAHLQIKQQEIDRLNECKEKEQPRRHQLPSTNFLSEIQDLRKKLLEKERNISDLKFQISNLKREVDERREHSQKQARVAAWVDNIPTILEPVFNYTSLASPPKRNTYNYEPPPWAK